MYHLLYTLFNFSRSSVIKSHLILLLIFFPTFLSAQTTYTVTASKLNVRASASVNGTIVGSLKKGESVSVNTTKNGWAEIMFKGQKRYVKSDYLQPSIASKREILKTENTEKTVVRTHLDQGSTTQVTSVNDRPTTLLPFVELQPIIVCAKGAKPRFEALFGVTFEANKYLSAGFGTGISTSFHDAPSVPLFGRLVVANKEWDFSPFMSIDAGYDFYFKHIKNCHKPSMNYS